MRNEQLPPYVNQYDSIIIPLDSQKSAIPINRFIDIIHTPSEIYIHIRVHQNGDMSKKIE